jgi:hypothetical protein
VKLSEPATQNGGIISQAIRWGQSAAQHATREKYPQGASLQTFYICFNNFSSAIFVITRFRNKNGYDGEEFFVG